MSLFLHVLEIGHFLLFNLEGFWHFFKPNNWKNSHGKPKLLLLSCREYLALGRVFVFSPNLKFFELLRKKSQNFDFYQEKLIFCTFCQIFKKKKSIPRHVWFSRNLGIFNSKLFLLACYKNFEPKKWFFVIFSWKKSAFFSKIWYKKFVCWLISIPETYTGVSCQIATKKSSWKIFRKSPFSNIFWPARMSTPWSMSV